MGDGTVKVSPSTLQSGSAVTSRHGAATDDLTNTVLGEFNTFLALLSPLAGEPIIGPGATALMGALDQAGSGLENALGCFGTGLKIMAPAMSECAQSFMSLDSTLASTFKDLDSLLPQVENYATSVKLITPTATEVQALKQFMTSASQGKVPQIQATTTAIKVQAPQKGGFMGWLGSHQWAAWTAVGVVSIAGVGLTLFTAGTSDGAAAAADTAILGADTAATVTADTAATAAVTTTAAADVTLTTVGGAEVFTTAGDAAISGYAEDGMSQIYAFLESEASNPLVTAGG